MPLVERKGWIENTSDDILNNLHVTMRLNPRREGPFDFSPVKGIDVVIHDDKGLHKARSPRPQGRHPDHLSIAFKLFLDGNDAIKGTAAPFSYVDLLNSGERDEAQDLGFDWYAH